MDILLNVEAVASQHDLKGLRHLYDLIESHVRALKSLGVSSDSYGALLSSVLLRKLPHELRLIVSRKTNDDDWNLDNLMKDEKSMRERELKPTRRILVLLPQLKNRPENHTRQLPCYLEPQTHVAAIVSRRIRRVHVES